MIKALKISNAHKPAIITVVLSEESSRKISFQENNELVTLDMVKCIKYPEENISMELYQDSNFSWETPDSVLNYHLPRRYFHSIFHEPLIILFTSDRNDFILTIDVWIELENKMNPKSNFEREKSTYANGKKKGRPKKDMITAKKLQEQRNSQLGTTKKASFQNILNRFYPNESTKKQKKKSLSRPLLPFVKQKITDHNSGLKDKSQNFSTEDSDNGENSQSSLGFNQTDSGEDSNSICTSPNIDGIKSNKKNISFRNVVNNFSIANQNVDKPSQTLIIKHKDNANGNGKEKDSTSKEKMVNRSKIEKGKIDLLELPEKKIKKKKNQKSLKLSQSDSRKNSQSITNTTDEEKEVAEEEGEEEFHHEDGIEKQEEREGEEDDDGDEDEDDDLENLFERKVKRQEIEELSNAEDSTEDIAEEDEEEGEAEIDMDDPEEEIEGAIIAEDIELLEDEEAAIDEDTLDIRVYDEASDDNLSSEGEYGSMRFD